MTLLYNIGIISFSFLIRVFSLFNSKAKLLKNGRQDALRKLKDLRFDDKPIWVHCASLGEFEQGRPVIESIKKNKPAQKVVLTFFSPSGYEVQKNYELADEVLYLPSDRPSNVRKFIEAINPGQVIFVKYEFWYHYLKALHKKGINTYIISAIFRPQHAFFKWYGGWYKKMLSFFTCLYVQDEKSALLLDGINVKNYVIAGDTRFDRVYEISQQTKSFPLVQQFAQNAKVMVGGSTWPKGEELLAAYLKENKKVKLLLAPHEIHDNHISEIEQLFADFKCARYTDVENIDLSDVRVLIINTMGMLSSMYQYGDLAYIGGGFGSGIHNTIEASTFGLPVIIGPNYEKYQEACDLIELNAGFCAANQDEFTAIANKLLLNDQELKKASEAAVNYVDKMRGATEQITKELFK